MAQYEIPDIVPYSDVYYVGCFYLPFFTAVKNLKGSVFSFITDNSYIYRLEQTEVGLSLDIENRETRSFSQITEDNGISYEFKLGYCEGINDIIMDALLKGHVIILPIDGFYYKHPYHDLFYLKEHHSHHILIYGFDSEREMFKTVEVDGFQWNTKGFCYKHEISFENLISCHQGICEYFKENPMPSLVQLSKKDPNKIVNDDPHFYKDIMIQNLKTHKNDILQGLQNIKTLEDNIEQFNISKAACFNNKVASVANEYKIKKVLGEEASYVPLLKNIVDSWIVIESLIYKSEFAGIKNKNVFRSSLHRLYDLESQLYNCLFSSF